MSSSYLSNNLCFRTLVLEIWLFIAIFKISLLWRCKYNGKTSGYKWTGLLAILSSCNIGNGNPPLGGRWLILMISCWLDKGQSCPILLPKWYFRNKDPYQSCKENYSLPIGWSFKKTKLFSQLHHYDHHDCDDHDDYADYDDHDKYDDYNYYAILARTTLGPGRTMTHIDKLILILILISWYWQRQSWGDNDSYW